MVRWQEMTGKEKSRGVEMARRGEKPGTEICETFGVSRSVLYKAMEKAESAAMSVLEPKTPGRKPKSEEAMRITELSKKNASLEDEKNQWKSRYEVAKAFIDITREDIEAEERKERNRRKQERKRNKKKQ